MNTKAGNSPLIGMCVTFGLLAVAYPCVLVVLFKSSPDRIPADVLLEEERAVEEELDDFEKKEDDGHLHGRVESCVVVTMFGKVVKVCSFMVFHYGFGITVDSHCLKVCLAPPKTTIDGLPLFHVMPESRYQTISARSVRLENDQETIVITFSDITMPVTVEEVIDEDQQFTADIVEDENDADFTDDDSDLESVSSAGTVDDETVYERIVALRDIVSPTTRRKISSFVGSSQAWAKWATQSAGTVAWIVTTSALLVGLPLALAMEDEVRIVQQEKELQMQQSGQQQLLGGPQTAQPAGVLPPGF